MAPVLAPPLLLEIFPWPHFQAVLDGQPAIGGQLYTYAPSTSTPKAAYHDPFSTTPHSHPIVLDDQGAATIYLDGPYDLRLFDADDVLIWSVDNYTFSSGVSPTPGLVQWGASEVTLDAVDGEVVLQASGLAPVGYRLLGLTTRILEDFGTSHGLTAIALGDAVVLDRYGVQGTLTVGAQTREQDWQSDTELLTAQPYALLVTAQGGTFDGSGQLRARLVWQTLADTDVPGADGAVISYGSGEATLTASDGALVLTASALAPANCRLLGLATEVLADFGTTRGLTALQLGDATLADRWGTATALSALTTTNLREAHSDTQPVAPPGYTVLVTAQGGAFDAQGQILVRLYWSVLTPV
jgi:hypothetical protein